MTSTAHSVAAPSSGVAGWLTTTDHKRIGLLYLVTATGFFFVSGLLALVMRAELAAPGLQFLDRATYNQFFTMHGTGMMFFFATAVVVGLANYLVPLQIGARDVAFPRLNALTYWMYLAGGLIVFAGFFTADGAASFGWTGYPPLSNSTYSPGAGGDLWIVGLLVSGISTTLGALNLLATIFGLRAEKMRMFRLPIFTWNIIVTSVLIMFSFPALTAALLMLFVDRNVGGDFFGSGGGDPVLYQHLFWFFGHPEVYIVILPFFGVVTEIIPVFSRKPLFGYGGFVFATLLIAAYSFATWAHHMFATGAVSNPFFSATTFLIAVPTGIKFFNWIATMWRGRISLKTPMLFCVGFLFTFLMGGITGIFLASPPIDFDVHDTYYVVAHFHYTLFGGSVFALFAGFYFWIPKFTGKLMDERLGKLHFWLMFVGFHGTFFVMHQLGLDGMPRRVPDYDAAFTDYNVIATAGSAVLGASMIVFVVNFVRSMRSGERAGDDPWGGYSLEWTTSSPPPHHNFDALPDIESERPAYDLRRSRDG